jgi:hypothetical protein
MIFKTIEEIKDHVSVQVSMDFQSVAPDIARAEREYLIPYLGLDFYTILEQDYQNDTLDTEQADLLEYCQDVVALFALHNYLPLAQVDISDTGVNLHSSDTIKTAWQWQIDDLSENYLLRLGYVALESMLSFLDENEDDYPEWVSDTGYTKNKLFIINSPSDFNEHYYIQKSALTYLSFHPLMTKVELFQIEPEIGSAFYAEIKQAIAQNNVSQDIQDLFKYLKPAIAHFTVAKALRTLPVTLRHDGVVVNSYEATTQNSRQRVPADSLLLNRAESETKDACNFMARLKKYLDENASSEKYQAYYDFKQAQDEPTPINRSRKMFRF